MNAPLIAVHGWQTIADVPGWVMLLLKMTAVLLAAWGVHLALWRSNPRWRVLMWRVTAVALVALTAVGWLFPRLEIHVEPSPVEEKATASPAPMLPSSDRAAVEAGAIALSSDPSDKPAAQFMPPVPDEPPELTESLPPPQHEVAASPRFEFDLLPWPRILLAIWLCGMGILVLRWLIGCRRIGRMVRRARQPPPWIGDECLRIAKAVGCRSRVDVGQSTLVQSPLLCGLLRPVVLLPPRMCEESYRGDLPAIFAHELTHVRFRDLVWNAGLHLVSIALWFHPLVWRLRRAHLAACELVCDAVAAGFVGNVNDYCRTLARVAVETVASLPAAGIAMARTSAIGRRLNVLKKQIFVASLRRRSTLGFGLAALLAAATLGTLQFALSAPSQAGKDQATTASAQLVFAAGIPAVDEHVASRQYAGIVSGRVFGVVGKPAGGATVWLVDEQFPDESKTFQRTVADAEGRFAFPPVKLELSGKSRRVPCLVARDAQGNLGGVGPVWRRPGESPRRDIEIDLVAVKDYQGRILDAVGKPIAGAVIRPYLFYPEGFIQPNERRTISVLEELSAGFKTQTDADGRFMLHGAPKCESAGAAVSAPGYGSLEVWWWRFDQPVDIRLEQPGCIEGTVICPADPKAAAGVEIGLSWLPDPGKTHDQRFSVSCLHNDTVTQSDGSFRFPDVPPGKYAIWGRTDSHQPYRFEKSEPLEVKPGTTTRVVSILSRKGVAVRGRVVDKATGTGIAGIKVQFSQYAIEHGWTTYSSTATDSRGEYLVQVDPGRLTVRVTDEAQVYLAPAREGRLSEQEFTRDATWPTVELQRAAVVEGIVVDGSGKPVPGAEIHYITSEVTPRREPVTTDAAGKFALHGVPPAERLSIRARTDTATTEETLIAAPGKMPGPVRLSLSGTKAFSLRGRVVDDTGRPLPRARVTVLMKWRTKTISGSREVVWCRTDGEGRFEIGGLWPGETYGLRIAAKGCEEYRPMNEIQGRAGQIDDLSTIVLTGTRGVIEGLVLDSQGKPVAGVRVFQSEFNWRRDDTTSDAAGRFRLAGFKSGPAFVFAEKVGYRFTGLHTQAGTRDATINLFRKEEPAPAAPPHSAPVSHARQQKVARKLLEELWVVADHKKLTGSTIQAMAWIDTAVAMKWSAELGRAYGSAELGRACDDSVREIAAERAAETDLDAALGLLAQEGQPPLFPLLKLAQRYAVSAPEKAARCVEEAVFQARRMDQPTRTVGIAKAGAFLSRLGNRQAGRKLVEEAAEMAAKMGVTPGESFARGAAAEALAAYDAGRALKLLEPASQGQDRRRYLAGVAASLDDPDRSMMLLKEADPLDAELATMRIIARLAPTRTADAIRIAETTGRMFQVGGKPAAYRILAAAVATRDKKLAWSLIDQGLTACREPIGDLDSSGFLAALLAVRAKEIGHPDMESVVYQTLSLRQNSFSDSTRLAEILALAEPEYARQLLQDMEFHAHTARNTGRIPVYRGYWLRAWALADLSRAAELAESELAAAKRGAGWDASRSGLEEMLYVLAIPPSERLADISGPLGYLRTLESER